MDVVDVAKAMVQLMRSNIKNEQFVLVGENLSYKELLSKLAPLFGKKPPTKKLPKQLMYFLSSMDWLSNKLFGTKRRLVRATVRSMFTKSRYDSQKIKNAIGFQFTPTEQTLKRIAKENKKT